MIWVLLLSIPFPRQLGFKIKFKADLKLFNCVKKFYLDVTINSKTIGMSIIHDFVQYLLLTLLKKELEEPKSVSLKRS